VSARTRGATPPPEKVTAHLIAASLVDGTRAIVRRTLVYTRVKSMLIADDDPPMGLKRIRVSDLPKVGGIFGLAVVALTESQAQETLRLVLERRRSEAQTKVDMMTTALRYLLSEPTDEAQTSR